jgi:hypothetical protein
VFYLLTLPIKIFFCVLLAILFLPFAILLVPFFLLRLVIKAGVLIVVLPFMLMAAAIGIAAAFAAVVLALLVPLLPIAFVVFCVWAVIRAASRPAYAR